MALLLCFFGRRRPWFRDFYSLVLSDVVKDFSAVKSTIVALLK